MADPVGLVTEIDLAPWATPVKPRVEAGLLTEIDPAPWGYPVVPRPEDGLVTFFRPKKETRVEIAFGYRPTDMVPAHAWTDVTDFLDAANSDFISLMSGRDDFAISPGAAGLILENNDGRFSRRNDTGPYADQLELGVPARVSLHGKQVWGGFISSGWPEDLTMRWPFISVTAHDLFGLLAQSDPPESAYAADLAVLRPDQWWRATSDGWIDRISRKQARHTGGLTEREPLVAGDSNPFGSEDPDGHGLVEDSSLFLNFTGQTIISLWFQIDDDSTDLWPLLSSGNATDEPNFLLAVGKNSLYFTAQRSASPGRIETTMDGFPTAGFEARPSRNFVDGKPHHLLLVIDWPVPETGSTAWWSSPAEDRPDFLTPPFSRSTDPMPRLWCDGTPVQLLGSISPHTSVGSRPTGLGYRPTQPSGLTRPVQKSYKGTIDHIAIWSDQSLSPDEAAIWAKNLHDSGRWAWSGDTLDQRVARIVTAMELGAHLGQLDQSGIVTQHGYRQGNAIELLQKIEDTEQGRIWVGNNGKLNFSARQWPNDTRSNTVQAIFSNDPDDLDAGIAIEMIDASIRDDQLDVTNVVQVTSEHGRMQTVENHQSVQRVGRRSPIHLSGLMHSSDRQSLAIGEWIMAALSEPRTKVHELSFDALGSLAEAFASEVEQGDLIEVRLLGPDVCGGGPAASPIVLHAHVRSVTRQWTAQDQRVTLGLVDMRTFGNWFRWNESTWDGTDNWSF